MLPLGQTLKNISNSDVYELRLSLNASSYFALRSRLDSVKYTLITFINF